MNFHSLCVFASLFAGDPCALSSGEDGRELTVGVKAAKWFPGSGVGQASIIDYTRRSSLPSMLEQISILTLPPPFGYPRAGN